MSAGREDDDVLQAAEWLSKPASMMQVHAQGSLPPISFLVASTLQGIGQVSAISFKRLPQ